MALSNLDRVNKGLALLAKGLHPFVLRELKDVHKGYWLDAAKASFPDGHPAFNKKPEQWDLQALLLILWKNWKEVFSKTLGHTEKAIVSELMENRKDASHQSQTNVFTTDDAYRALDNVERILSEISAPEAEEADLQKAELLRIRYEESTKKKARKIETQLIESSSPTGLIPWRQVITPHPDVASGKYQQAEFAADLWRVYQDGANAGEYGKPIEFFSRTYLTNGLRRLLLNALKRMNGQGGDPVINLQTNFGGGKTHSLLALFHLFSDADFSSIRDMESFFEEASDIRPPKRVNKAIIVGNRISPGVSVKKPDGTTVNTLWGEMAWQLGGKEGYKIVKESDEQGTSPGDQLVTLFKKFAPCIILIDEWVAYLRQLHESDDQICGTYGTHITFAQVLTESVKAVDNAMVVISVPASAIEMGGDKGKQAAEELRNVIGRTESPWSAATTKESFEIVTRRLFSPIVSKEQFANRDMISKSFGDFYRNNIQDFPRETGSADYEQRVRDYYPIHPELFDALAERWASIDKFQKTRGILRLMAKIIHFLWANDDQSPLIMPAQVPLDDSEIFEELMRYLDDPWRAVIRKDVDGEGALPRQLDSEFPNIGRFSGTRRVARTLFFGSAPTFNAANRGIDEQRIKLGSIIPGETIPTFSDALRHLADRATYVYGQNKNYWYSTQNNVNRTAEERAVRISEEKVEEEIRSRISSLVAASRSQLSKVHLMPKGSNDVLDDMDLKLVILGLDQFHINRDQNSPAFNKAKEILSKKGSSQRVYRNTLIFLAPDKSRLEELKHAVQFYLAWKSIQTDRVSLNLDPFQSTTVDSKVTSSNDTVKLRVPETFIWILTPYQDSGSPEVAWDESKINGSPTDPLTLRVTKKLLTQSQLYNDFASSELRINLDKVPLWRGNYVPIKMLREDFAKYLYLPKLLTPDLLSNAIHTGVGLVSWKQDSFAYAESYDEASGRFRGLQGGKSVMISLEGNGLLVKSEVAMAQLAQEAAEIKESQPPKTEPGVKYPTPTPSEPVAEETPKSTRLYGDIDISPVRFYRDAESIEKEILKHLTSIKGVDVKITLHIEAESNDGFAADTERTIKENGRTLGFSNVEFE
jgi:predicted AAA+ superfamily ATPase